MIKVNVKQFRKAVEKTLQSKNFPDVLLRAFGSVLEIKSVDYDSYFSVFIDAIIQQDITALVNRKSLLNILKAVKSDTISLSKQDKELILNTEQAVYRLKAKDPSLFNTLGLDKDISNGIILSSKAILQAIEDVIYAVSKEKSFTYEVFKNIGFIFRNNSFYIVGTDGTRLAICDLKLPNSLDRWFGIPKSFILHLKKIFDKDVLFGVVDGVAVFKADDFVFSARINDEYPDPLSIINDYKQYVAVELKVPKEALLNILKSFIGDKKSMVKLILTNDNLTLLSNNSEANVCVSYRGDRYEITFQTLYLLEALENMGNDEVIIKVPSTSDYAAYVEPVSGCDCLALIMPTA